MHREGILVKRLFWTRVPFLLSVVLAGCASIVSKSEYAVSITSKPEGAEIAVTNRENKRIFQGRTPTTVSLKAGAGYFKGEKYTVTFEKEGYATHAAQIERGVDGWYIGGNILLGGLIGWLIVDPATGAMWTLEDLHVDLTEQTSSIPNQINIVSIYDVPDHLCPKMISIRQIAE